jgi:hypothetical protein
MVLKNSLRMTGPVERVARSARRTLNGNCMPVTLSGRRCRAAGSPFFGSRYEWTDHQGFDPNRDNRHFWRGGFSDCWVGLALLGF